MAVLVLRSFVRCCWIGKGKDAIKKHYSGLIGELRRIVGTNRDSVAAQAQLSIIEYTYYYISTFTPTYTHATTWGGRPPGPGLDA